MNAVIFIHGAGVAGTDAWPLQATQDEETNWHFLPREGVADEAARDARRVIEWLRTVEGGHLVAHSYGANAALLAAQQEPALVLSLALLEPACFDLARGMLAVEEHIAAMAPVFAVADDVSVSAREFSQMFAAAMGVAPPELPEGVLAERVSRLRALRPPWDLGLRREALAVRTLVITSGSDPLYSETAQALASLGARHVTLEGAGHRVQDDPRVMSTMRDHWRG